MANTQDFADPNFIMNYCEALSGQIMFLQKQVIALKAAQLKYDNIVALQTSPNSASKPCVHNNRWLPNGSIVCDKCGHDVGK
jgi:hypothetical protein